MIKSKAELDGAVIPELEAMLGGNLGKKVPQANRWSEAEENILRRYYGKVPTKNIAQTLGKSTTNVKAKASRLGISYHRKENA